MRPRTPRSRASCARSAEGKRVALVSDAGMPLISDPGYRLVRAALAAGHAVTRRARPVGGADGAGAVGPADRPLLLRRLPAGEAGRAAARHRRGGAVPATLVFFEAPHRLAASLADLAELLGDRPAAVARELTKLFEEVRRAPLERTCRALRRAGRGEGRDRPGDRRRRAKPRRRRRKRSMLHCGRRWPERRSRMPQPKSQRALDFSAVTSMLAPSSSSAKGVAIMTIETRRQANRLGHAAEWRAVWRLRLAGYSILARRYKTRLGEIDIVARRGGVLAFVEVKARADYRDGGLLAPRPAVRPGRARGQPVRGAPSALCRAFAALRCDAGGRAMAAPSAGRLARAGVVRAARLR